MLQHRRDLGYVPEPLPDTESLAAMIRIAGSTDPLDRLWCWINSQNAFDYADLVQNADGYRLLLSELESHGDSLVGAARVAHNQSLGHTHAVVWSGSFSTATQPRARRSSSPSCFWRCLC